jgi:hypothetical protein
MSTKIFSPKAALVLAAGLAAVLAAAPVSATARTAPAPAPQATTSLHYTNNVSYSSKPAAVGFNLWDTGPDASEIDSLPAGHKALVWVGDDVSTCTSQYTDAQFQALVNQFARDQKVFGWYLWDEPDVNACPSLAALLTRRAGYIRTKTGGAQKSFVASGGGDGEAVPPALAPSRSGIDLLGLDPYPCRIGESCEYDLINHAVNQSVANGTPVSALVPVYQTFGQTCSSIPTDNRKWRMPTSSEMTQILARWDSLVPHPVFDDAYSWGAQSEWACPSLSGNTTLQNLFKTRFSS